MQKVNFFSLRFMFLARVFVSTPKCFERILLLDFLLFKFLELPLDLRRGRKLRKKYSAPTFSFTCIDEVSNFIIHPWIMTSEIFGKIRKFRYNSIVHLVKYDITSDQSTNFYHFSECIFYLFSISRIFKFGCWKAFSSIWNMKIL